MSDDDLSGLADQIANELGEEEEAEESSESSEEGGGGDAASALLSALGGDGDEEEDEDSGGGGGGGGGDSGEPVDPTIARDRNLDLILDIPLRVTVELGRTKMIVSDLLNLGQGSVVELSKLAGESMEVLVNDQLVAKGEAVVVNEKFGVRLTDIISKQERVEQLG